MVEERGEPFLLPLPCDLPYVTHVPGPAPGACFAGSHSPWPPHLAPPTPQPVARLCSSASQLLLRSLTSHVRSSSATAPRLPDAGQSGAPQLARRGISRFPSKELLHMPGSSTTPGRSDLALVGVWFASILRAPRHLSNGTALSRACGLDCAPPLGGVSTTPGALARVRVVVSRSVIT